MEECALFLLEGLFFVGYLVGSQGHVVLAELKDGLSGAHVQSVTLLAQQQSGVVKDARLRELHQVQI